MDPPGIGYEGNVGAALPLSAVVFTAAITLVLLLVVALFPSPRRKQAALIGAVPPDDGHPRIRLLSRVLFARCQPDSIMLDCLLVAVEQAAPGVTVAPGMPFTLQLRAPTTGWFADRVERLLTEWADENRELLLELHEDHGKVRTRIASGESSVQLELSGAAGLQLNA